MLPDTLLAHSLTYSSAQLFTHQLSHLITPSMHSPTLHLLTRSLTRPLSHSVTHSLTHSLRIRRAYIPELGLSNKAAELMTKQEQSEQVYYIVLLDIDLNRNSLRL